MTFKIAVQKYQGDRMLFEDLSFKTLDTLRDYHLGVPDSSHYEVISEKQCLYFDFDAREKIDFSELVEKIVTEVAKINEKLDVKVLLFDSCDSIKFSYHVIVKGFCLKDHLENSYLANKIINAVKDPKIVKYFDSSVYTSRRNLRMLGSRKIDSMRVKKFNSVLYGENSFVFFESLVCDTRGFETLDIELPLDIPKNNEHKITLWDQDDILKVQNYLDKKYHGIFSISESGNFLALKRKKPGHCFLCDRVHSTENSFVFKRQGAMYFACRRNEDKNYDKIDDSDEDEVFVLNIISVKEEKQKKKLLDLVREIYSFN